MLDNHLRQALHDGTLSYARLSDEDGVVLLSAPKNLDDALYLVLATHNRIKHLLGSSLCQVGAEVVEHGCLAVAPTGTGGRRATFLLTACLGVFAGCVFHVLLVVLVREADAIGRADVFLIL